MASFTNMVDAFWTLFQHTESAAPAPHSRHTADSQESVMQTLDALETASAVAPSTDSSMQRTQAGSAADHELEGRQTLPTLLRRSQAPSSQVPEDAPVTLPTLLGRSSVPTAQTLPAERSPQITPQEMLLQRRQRRARTATVRDTSDFSEILGDVGESTPVMRPTRVVLGAADGKHSTCLCQDTELRMRFVSAGLPGGPVLKDEETCAICLEVFESGDLIQPMANCGHVFHAACAKTLLHSKVAGSLALRSTVPCPLCRSPMLATSLDQLPCRERTHAVSCNAAWLSTPPEAEAEKDSACSSGSSREGDASGPELTRSTSATVQQAKQPALVRRSTAAM